MRQTIPPAGLLVTGLWLEQPSSDIEIDNGEVGPVFTNTISPVSVCLMMEVLLVLPHTV